MQDARLKGLFVRQKKSIDFARTMIPIFARMEEELAGDTWKKISDRDRAFWLNGNKIETPKKSKKFRRHHWCKNKVAAVLHIDQVGAGSEGEFRRLVEHDEKMRIPNRIPHFSAQRESLIAEAQEVSRLLNAAMKQKLPTLHDDS